MPDEGTAWSPATIEATWQPVRADLWRLGAPCEIEWLGGGCIVMEFPSENPDDRVWLGAEEGDVLSGDGPWLTDTLDVGVVGGYRNTWNSKTQADDTSALVQEVVTHRGDSLSIAEAMATAWRRLRSAPVTQYP